MRFNVFNSTMAMASCAAAAVSGQQMVANIDAITQKSSETNDIAQTMSVTNFFSTAPQVINNFRDIITLVTNDITSMDSKRSIYARQDCLNLEDVEECLDDIEAIVEDPSEILGDKKKRQSSTYSDTVIGKHGLLSLTPFTQPIAAVLRDLEGGVDTIAFAIIDDVPTCAQDATQNKNALDSTLSDAINTYND